MKRIDSIIIMALLFSSLFVFTSTIQPVKAQETIYIMPDGSINPATANITTSDNVTYTFTGNNSLPIYVGRSNIIINGKGYKLQASGGNGFSLYNMNNVTISNTTIENSTRGVYIQNSSGIVVSGNNITVNSQDGIFLYSSNGNKISGNNITANGHSGILTWSSSNNRIIGNSATGNSWNGIYIYSSSDGNTLSGNNIAANIGNSISLESSSNNIITSNRMANNSIGLQLLDASRSNAVYHNNFINNTIQAGVDSTSTGNAWNSTYPSGGNYWSDYTGVDQKKGPYQNLIGRDGIGDTPYVIIANNSDNYPLMEAYSPLSVTISPASATLDVGQFMLFTSSAMGGSSPYSYQWYLNGAAVFDATTATWLFTPSSTGYYAAYVNVTDVAGVSVLSSTASATVSDLIRALIPLSGWAMDPLYTNALYVLNSGPSSLYVQLNAANTTSKVTISNFNIPKLSLSDYTYVNVKLSGTDNARILLRFFMDDGTCFDVVYWGSSATLNATKFDLSPYAGRTLSEVYLALMSLDGKQATINITQIAFSAQVSKIPLAGWQEDPTYTNAPYVLNSNTSSLYLELDAIDTTSKVTIFNPSIPKLKLSSYAYVNVTVSGTDNARILLRFFMDDGTCFDVVYWSSLAALSEIRYDLSPYAARTLSGVVYVSLMSSDGARTNITITQIAFSTQALPPTIPLSGWNEEPAYTNAPYVLNSNPTSLYLELNAENTTSRVTIFNLNVPKLSLSSYTYVDATVTGTGNARILLRFFMHDGSCFDVVYWQSATTLDAMRFDLSPYTARTLSGEVYVSLMSSDGKQANITITQIAFSTQALPPSLPTIPLFGWQEDPAYTNALYVLNSNPSNLYLELDAADISSKVTISNFNIPKLSLSDYTYVSTIVAGTDNARVLLRFFMDDGTCFDVVYWGSPAALNATQFDLSPYAGRTLSEVYVALMSSDGNPVNITITQIAFVHA